MVSPWIPVSSSGAVWWRLWRVPGGPGTVAGSVTGATIGDCGMVEQASSAPIYVYRHGAGSVARTAGSERFTGSIAGTGSVW